MPWTYHNLNQLQIRTLPSGRATVEVGQESALQVYVWDKRYEYTEKGSE